MISPDKPLIARLAEHLQRPVPEPVRQRARLHLLDWLACVAGARQSRVGKISSWSLPGCAGPAAVMGNVLEMDDVHRAATLHPGPVIWAACMHHTPKTMPDMLDMAARGYEAMIAVGATFDAHHYASWHPTATAGAIGAAAATSSYYSPDYAEACAWAMANAASVTGGLWHMRHDDSMAKQWHVLASVRTGSEAAWLAMDGLTGPLAILEGPQGLYAAMCREPKPMALGPGWRIEEVSFKPWAACRHAHPAIDCALELRAAGRLTAPFHVETYADALTFCDNPHPRPPKREAKFSLQHAVAVIASGRAMQRLPISRLRAIAELARPPRASHRQRRPRNHSALPRTFRRARERPRIAGLPRRPRTADGRGGYRRQDAYAGRMGRTACVRSRPRGRAGFARRRCGGDRRDAGRVAVVNDSPTPTAPRPTNRGAPQHPHRRRPPYTHRRHPELVSGPMVATRLFVSFASAARAIPWMPKQVRHDGSGGDHMTPTAALLAFAAGPAHPSPAGTRRRHPPPRRYACGRRGRHHRARCRCDPRHRAQLRHRPRSPPARQRRVPARPPPPPSSTDTASTRSNGMRSTNLPSSTPCRSSPPR